MKFSLPKLGSAKDPSDEDTEDEIDFVSDEDGAGGADDAAEDDFDDDDGADGARRRKMPAMWILGAVGLVAVLAVAGGVYWLIAGGDSAETAGDSKVPRVEILLPPKGAGVVSAPRGEDADSARAALSPPRTPPRQAAAGTVEVPAVSAAAFQDIPLAQKDESLSNAPDPELVEESVAGLVPKIGDDGRRPWQVYAKQVNAPGDLLRIALIVEGLGLNRLTTEAAIHRLPGTVTLAFDPYAENLAEWVAEARRAGHETLIEMPLESLEFPARNAGPLAVTASLGREENNRRILSVLARHPGQVGVVAVHGSNIAPVDERIRPVLETLVSRGLMVVDATNTDKSLIPQIAAEIGLPRAFADRSLRAPMSQQNVDAELDLLEKEARKKASVVMVARAYPVSVERQAKWTVALNSRNFALVPVSAMADKQFLP